MKKGQIITIVKARSRIIPLLLLGVLLVTIGGCTVYTHDVDTEFRGVEQSRVKRFFIKQRLLTLGDQFVIRDQWKQPIFTVKGKLFTIGDRLKFMDLEGREVFYIKEKFFSFSHLYRIFRGETLYAKMWKRLTFFKNKFIIDVPGSNQYIVQGNFLNYRYNVFHNGERVAVVSKKWPAWTDHYKIEIIPGEDELLILAAVVVIDMVTQKEEEHHSVAYYD